MTIHDLIRVSMCTRKEMLKNIDFTVAYVLFRIALAGKDDIPGIGVGSLSIKEGKHILEIELSEVWQKLLGSDDITQILADRLTLYFENRKE